VAQLTIGEAAAVLHTAVSTLRSWEQRYGFPEPRRSASGRRLYDEAEILLLSDAFRRGLTISSAIRQIRSETGSHVVLMREAMLALDHATCNALLEAAIAVRGVSRAFDDAVLVALESLAAHGGEPDVVGLAVEWARDRACWGRRQAAAPALRTVLLVDSSSEASVTRGASYVLELQLELRSVRAFALRGPPIGEYHSAVRKLAVDTIVFVGHPPRSARRARSIVPAHHATFRADDENLDGRVETLPSAPRRAAEALLAARASGAERIYA
jgi:DNA-binding transcriptional MerR regulator